MVPASHALFNFFLDIFTPPKLRICMLYNGLHLQITLNLLESALLVYTTRMPCLSKTCPDFVKRLPHRCFPENFLKFSWTASLLYTGKFCHFFWSHLLKKSLIENFIVCGVKCTSKQNLKVTNKHNSCWIQIRFNSSGCICISPERGIQNPV